MTPDPVDRLKTPEFQPVRPRRSRGRRILRALFVLLILGGGGAAAWHYYGERIVPGRDKEVPTVRADAKPYKVRPENPGGMPVPDRDKLVYERIQGTGKPADGKTPKVEHLLPPPEVPVATRAVPKPETGAAPATAPTPSPQAAPPAITPPPPAAPAQSIQPPRVAEGPTAGAATLPATPPASEARALKRPDPAPAPAEPVPQVAARKPEPAPPMRAAAFQVQLGALRSQEHAENEWAKMRRSQSDLLGELELSVARADLGETKGIFYRVRAGPIVDEAAARALCNKLAERKIGCLVVRPGQ